MTDDRRRPATRRFRARLASDRAWMGGGEATTSARTRASVALPNVLSSETLPNTLSGVGPPSRPARRNYSLPTLAGLLVVAILIVLGFLLGR